MVGGWFVDIIEVVKCDGGVGGGLWCVLALDSLCRMQPNMRTFQNYSTRLRFYLKSVRFRANSVHINGILWLWPMLLACHGTTNHIPYKLINRWLLPFYSSVLIMYISFNAYVSSITICYSMMTTKKNIHYNKIHTLPLSHPDPTKPKYQFNVHKNTCRLQSIHKNLKIKNCIKKRIDWKERK